MPLCFQQDIQGWTREGCIKTAESSHNPVHWLAREARLGWSCLFYCLAEGDRVG